MKVEILSSRTKEVIHTINDVSIYTTIGEIKTAHHKAKPHLYPDRQSFRKESRGPILDNDVTLRSLEFDSVATLYFKDLGPQVGWKTVFVAEYAGPFFLYFIFYLRPSFVYGADARDQPIHPYVHICCVAYLFHYLKRILETLFIHRFSHGTMPLRNLFKNCSYYWICSCFIAYYINHPLYTHASFGDLQFYGSLVGFVLCQFGNYSCHIVLRNLRPEGSRERKIPYPSLNPFTKLFDLVSCPNYTYEIGSWFWFSIMSQAVASFAFAILGGAQMFVWALKKHRNYRKEFKDYPRCRKAIFPYLL